MMLMLVSAFAASAQEEIDTIPKVTPTVKPIERKDWFEELKKGRFDPKDTTVYYPKFMQFCVDVYNWADYTFNSVDTTYIASTGRRWKA